jgi:hypothetical protein
MNATALKFHRIEAGQYQGDTDAHRYLITKTKRGWVLRVWRLLETSGVKHTIGLRADDVESEATADTKALVVDIARRYDQLIQDSYGKLFTDLPPMTRAVIDAHQAEATR